MPKTIIGLVGAAGVGKDTVRQMLEENFDFAGVAFADPMRDMLGALLTAVYEHPDALTDREQKELPVDALGVSPRQLMQTLGDWGRAQHPNWWVNVLSHTARHLGARVVISDVRVANEARWVRSQGGTLWRIVRNDAPVVRGHSSEAEHLEITCDLTIHNHGTLDELWLQVEQHVNLTRSPWAQARDDVFAQAVQGVA
jgi:hypothetical protein